MGAFTGDHSGQFAALPRHAPKCRATSSRQDLTTWMIRPDLIIRAGGGERLYHRPSAARHRPSQIGEGALHRPSLHEPTIEGIVDIDAGKFPGRLDGRV